MYSITIFSLILFLNQYLFSEENSACGKKIGLVFNTEAFGIQGEYMLTPAIGLSMMGIKVFGLGLNNNEYIYTAVIAPVAHPINTDTIDLKITGGIASSYHHWETGYGNNKGNIYDITIGGGGGFVYKLTNTIFCGINLWINYDYATMRYLDRVEKGGRFFLLMPHIEFTICF